MIELRTLLVILHVLGTAVGVGGATASDFLFFRSIKDNMIDKSEMALLNAMSFLLWVGLIILILTGAGFVALYFLTAPALDDVYSSAKMISKAIIVMIIILNGFVLNLKVTPLFNKHVGKPFTTPELQRERLLIFTSGAVSIVSWYAAMIIGAWRGLQASLGQILGVYGFILVSAILISNILGFWLSKKSTHALPPTPISEDHHDDEAPPAPPTSMSNLL